MGEPTALNQKVFNWAAGQLGKQVGAGECWDLANSALKKSGGQTSSDLGPTGEDDDYVWGDVVDLKDALPGDILQYRDWEMMTTTTTDVTFKDEYGWFDSPTVTVGHAHHTSIVATNPGNGVLTVMEQNHLGNHERVRNSTIRWKSPGSKSTTTKKPMKRRDNGKTETATVVVTVDISVSGSVTAYRPVKK